MANRVQLTGGNFQDAEGNVLANGYLTFRLSQAATIAGTLINLCPGIEITIALDADGNVVTSPAQYLWANDQMSPPTFYRVTAYSAQGRPVWGPNNQQITGDGGTFDLGQWVPNQLAAGESAGTVSPVATLLSFQDPMTNPVAGGSVSIRLVQDASFATSGGPQIMASREVKATLDDTGTAVVNLYPTDVMQPTGLYIVEAKTAQGLPAWRGELTVPSA